MSNVSNINISPQNIAGKCDLKCAFNFSYSESNSTATNNGTMISLTYDNSSVPPVTFNNQKYTVSNIMIVSPSLHTFNGDTTDAEIVVEHTPVLGGPALHVAVPIVASSETSTASAIITDIIHNVATNAPSQGNSTNLNIDGFTLQNIIPVKPFYSYTDKKNVVWIVFGSIVAIPLRKDTLDTLGQIIDPYPLPMKGSDVFYNSSGPNTSTAIGDGIYISCKPTGSSEEQVAVDYNKNTPSYDLQAMLNGPQSKIILQIIVCCAMFIFLFIGLSSFYSWITKGSSGSGSGSKTFSSIKMPNLGV